MDTRAAILDVFEPISRARGVELNDATVIARDLELDSMRTLELVMDLEERLSISIPLNILTEVQTLADLHYQIDRLTNS